MRPGQSLTGRGLRPSGMLLTALQLLFVPWAPSVAWRFFAANSLAVLGGALSGLSPLALKEMVDAAAGAGAPSAALARIASFGAAYLLCLSTTRLCAELRQALVGAAEQQLYARLRKRYFEQLLSLPLAFHRARNTGGLAQALQQAISGYQIILSSCINNLIPVVVEAITVATVLTSLSQPALAASFALTALVLCMAIASHTTRLGTAAQAVTVASLDVQAALSDRLINYEPIKCYGAERNSLDHFSRLSQALESQWRRLQGRRLATGLTVALVIALSLALSLAITLHALFRGSLTMGGFVLANLYMVQIVRPLEMLSFAARDLSQGLAFVRPLMEVLEAPQEQTGPPAETTEAMQRDNGAEAQSLRTPRPGAALSFRGVRLRFDSSKAVLAELDLDIPAGRSLAIVGASGCGKSSLVRLLLRLSEPDAGSIMLDGVAINALPVAELRSRLAVVPQDVTLLNGTIEANIAMGREGASTADIERAAGLAGLHGLVEVLPLGYQTLIGERGLKLSGGERQRIAIARAVLRDASVYILDEATSMLDSRTEGEIMRNIARIANGRTMIVIAHRLSAIKDMDEIAVLADGKLVERGDHAVLLARGGLYASMWGDQQSG